MTTEPREAGLVARARAGERHALAELFERYADDVYQVALRITASRADAEDVTQNVFAGLPEALSAYGGTGELGAW
ncbi:MAG: sigma factor, partial [Longimicrobiales bacterium]|nr:sigma factor [Longimicrobiales bacterium]